MSWNEFLVRARGLTEKVGSEDDIFGLICGMVGLIVERDLNRPPGLNRGMRSEIRELLTEGAIREALEGNHRPEAIRETYHFEEGGNLRNKEPANSSWRIELRPPIFELKLKEAESSPFYLFKFDTGFTVNCINYNPVERIIGRRLNVSPYWEKVGKNIRQIPLTQLEIAHYSSNRTLDAMMAIVGDERGVETFTLPEPPVCDFFDLRLNSLTEEALGLDPESVSLMRALQEMPSTGQTLRMRLTGTKKSSERRPTSYAWRE